MLKTFNEINLPFLPVESKTNALYVNISLVEMFFLDSVDIVAK